MTQNEMVLKHLQTYGTISTYEAFTEYGITRLSARISDLKAKGYTFTDEFISKKNRYGEKVSFKKYKLERDDKD